MAAVRYYSAKKMGLGSLSKFNCETCCFMESNTRWSVFIHNLLQRYELCSVDEICQIFNVTTKSTLWTVRSWFLLARNHFGLYDRNLHILAYLYIQCIECTGLYGKGNCIFKSIFQAWKKVFKAKIEIIEKYSTDFKLLKGLKCN